MKLTVSRKSVETLYNLGNQLPRLYKDMEADIKELRKAFVSNQVNMGPHVDMLNTMIGYVEKSEEASKDILEHVSKSLIKKADEMDVYLRKQDWTSSMLTNEEIAIMKEVGGFVEYSSSIPQDMKFHTPKESGTVIYHDQGFTFIPHKIEALTQMKEYGADAIQYIHDSPDFSPFTNISTPWGNINTEVEIGHMTTSRHNPVYELGSRPKGTSHDQTYDLGNFAQADNALADKINATYHSDITGKDVQVFREANDYTWHECADGKTMQLISTTIHAACPHSGGVSLEKMLQAYGNYEDEE